MSYRNPNHRPRGTQYQAHIITADYALARLVDDLATYCTETETLLFTELQTALDWLSQNGSQNPSAITDPPPRADY